MRAKKETTTLKRDVEKLHQEKEQWKDETHQLPTGLSVKIENQFTKRQLAETGFLLLKGIADIRDIRIKTVQQQSQSIYQKTGLASHRNWRPFSWKTCFLPKIPPGNCRKILYYEIWKEVKILEREV